MNKKFLYILNPISGDGEERDTVLEKIRKELPDIDFEILKTKGKDDVNAIQKTLSQKPQFDGILIGGGDGTVRLVVGAVIDADIPLGIIPLGSANGMAKCLGINNIDEAITAVSKAKVKSLDFLEINDEICLHLSDFGFNAGLIKKFDAEDRRGMITYFKSTLRQFFDMQPFRFEVSAKGKSQTVEAKMLVIANGDKYGTGASINPTGKMDDGFMEIISINPSGFDEIASISIDMFRGVLDKSDYVKIWKLKYATIKNLDNADFQIDGEIIPNTKEIKVSCKAQKIKFFTHYESSEATPD